MCVCVQGSTAGIQTLNTLEPDRLQHDSPAACVIAQQYFSATFVSPRFHCRKERFGTHFKKFCCFIFILPV
jgi:hypothetical protein